MFDIDKPVAGLSNGNKYTALQFAISSENPQVVELLLKKCHTNPNVVDSSNCTTLMFCAAQTERSLPIMRLLVEYRFDFAKLINQRHNGDGCTLFHTLCSKTRGNINDNIACLKYLFDVCKKIPNCSINILARDNSGTCGLHKAVLRGNADMVKYLLENVYFPNNNKLNRDGVAFMNMSLNEHYSLLRFVLMTFYSNQNIKCGLEIFKLLVSYGMKVNLKSDTALTLAVLYQQTEIVEFILNENLCPIYTLMEFLSRMYPDNAALNGIPNTKIMKAVYNYGLKHGIISNKNDHSQLIGNAARYNVTTFKTTILMILEKHGIKHLEQYGRCYNIDIFAMVSIADLPSTTPNVKSFIKALINGDETQKTTLIKLDTVTSNEIVLTCINNHELTNNNNSKISNYKGICSICSDNNDGSESLSGIKCHECKSFICGDCIIVQKVSKKMNINPYDSHSHEQHQLQLSLLEEILHYKDNKKLFTKVKSLKCLFTCYTLPLSFKIPLVAFV